MDYIKNFGEFLTSHGKAQKTVESYTGDLRGYFGFLSDRDIAFEGILNRFTIISYKNHLLEHHYEPVTINKKLNSILSFNIFLNESNLMTETVIKLPRDRIKIAKGSEKPVKTWGRFECLFIVDDSLIILQLSIT